jgi:hypothetical protein
MIKRDHSETRKPDQPTTFHQLARAGLELETSGRFSVDAAVVGSTEDAGALYPAASPAQSDAVGLEPPTGEDLEFVEPVGTPAELRTSAAEREQEFWDLYNMISIVMADFPDVVPDHIRELDALRPQIEADAAMLAGGCSVEDAIAAWRRATRGIELMSKYHNDPVKRAKLRAELRRGKDAMAVASRGRIE